jgi:hypothetical protein
MKRPIDSSSINNTTVAELLETKDPAAQRSTTNSPDRTLVEGMRMMMSRLATINNVLPFPLTVDTSQNVIKLFYSELLQSPLENLLGLPHTELLLHLLEEVRHMEP